MSETIKVQTNRLILKSFPKFPSFCGPGSPSAPVSLAHCSSQMGVASDIQMQHATPEEKVAPTNCVLTRAGGLLPFSFILTTATSLVAQVLKVHLDLLAVLFHQGFTCVQREMVATTAYLDIPTSVAHSLANKSEADLNPSERRSDLP